MNKVQETVGLQRVTLRELVPECCNALVIGIIIAKQNARKFSKANTGGIKECAVWNFTFRDSHYDYINVTCWDSSETIFELYYTYHIGDVVEIHQPRIDIRQVNDNSEQFRPMVTSPYFFTLNSAAVQLVKHASASVREYQNLLCLPTKPLVGAVTLADVHNSARGSQAFVDLLGAVRSVGKARKINTKDDRQQEVRDVIILDHTHPELKITIWDYDIIVRAANWTPCNTILFMTDVRLQWSEFSKGMTASLTSRTIITENPKSQEVDKLREFARNTPLEPIDILNSLAYTIPNVNAIQNVMNIKQVREKINMITSSLQLRPDENMFTCVLFAVVTQFDLDGLSRVVVTKCTHCNTVIDKGNEKCTNEYCKIALGLEKDNSESNFDVRLMLSDQTGTLVGCRLNGPTAESILHCSAEEFLAMNDGNKSELKWSILMERCEIRIMVLCMKGRNPLISVLSCNLANPSEVASKLPHY